MKHSDWLKEKFPEEPQKSPEKMKFLERTLEDIIFNHTEQCCKRGLDIGDSHTPFIRQFNLREYGIIDLIRFYYEPYSRIIYCQIIELKKAKIDLNAYSQIKRYQTGIAQLLECWFPNYPLVFELFLIGDEVQKDGDFLFVYCNDDCTSIYTYEYGFDGIRFHKDEKSWVKASFVPEKLKHEFIEVLEESIDTLNEERDIDWEEHKFNVRKKKSAFFITSDGIVFNPDFLEIPAPEEEGFPF